MNCLILHGTRGSSRENWFPWLKGELIKSGLKTEVPDFPHSDTPDLDDWLNHLKDYQIDENTVLVGHSMGSVLILRLLEQRIKIKAAFLVAAFAHDLGWEVLRDSHFFNKPFDWETIKNNCKHFEVFTSKNDPHLKIEDGAEVADNLKIENQVLDAYKHFNMTEFPFLLERIKNNL